MGAGLALGKLVAVGDELRVGAGDQLDNFRIESVVVRSGMASNLRGTDTRTGQPGAIKVPHPEMECDPKNRYASARVCAGSGTSGPGGSGGSPRTAGLEAAARVLAEKSAVLPDPGDDSHRDLCASGVGGAGRMRFYTGRVAGARRQLSGIIS